MICVFCLSHVPALLTSDIPGYEGRNVLLIAFLVFVVQISDVLQYVWGKLLGPDGGSRPGLSPSKTVEGFVGGVLSATLVGAGLWWMTPFTVAAGGPPVARHHADGLLRRARHVGDQARPRRQGLGAPDRRPWRLHRPPRFGVFSRRRSSFISCATGGPSHDRRPPPADCPGPALGEGPRPPHRADTDHARTRSHRPDSPPRSLAGLCFAGSGSRIGAGAHSAARRCRRVHPACAFSAIFSTAWSRSRAARPAPPAASGTRCRTASATF